MIRLAVTGAAGRMGQRIIDLAGQDERFTVVAALEAAGHPQIGGSAGGAIVVTDRLDKEFDVLLDFSTPAGTVHWLAEARKVGKPMVTGTTGLDQAQQKLIEQAAGEIPIVKAANMSVGINLLLKIAGQVAKVLGEDYDIEIVEAHHRFKKDAPSGTAFALLEAVCGASGKSAQDVAVHGREGRDALRDPGQIGVHAIRLGDVVGQHEVYFGTIGETISLKHVAHTRDTFVQGALRACAWIKGKRAGLYSMHAVQFGPGT